MTCQLPPYTFLINENQLRVTGKWSEGLINLLILFAFLSQKDHYVLKVKDEIYVEDMLSISQDVPSWQALIPLSPATNIIEFRVM